MKLNVAKKYKEIKYKIFDLSQKNQTMVWKNIWIPPQKSQGFLPGFLMKRLYFNSNPPKPSRCNTGWANIPTRAL
jgi:hypothetical protein